MKIGSTTALTPALSPRRGRILRRLSRIAAVEFAGHSSENQTARDCHPLSPGEMAGVRAGVNTNVCRPFQQPEGLLEISRGLSESASDTPGQRSKKQLHPEGVREGLGFFQRFWHPFRVQEFLIRLTGGVAALNHRLISGTPSACFGLLASLVLMLEMAGAVRANAARSSPVG